MKKKWTPYLLLAPQIISGSIFLIGLINGIIQSLGVIPAFGLTVPTLQYYKEILNKPELLKSVLYSLYIAFTSAAISTVAGVLLCGVLVMGKRTKSNLLRIIQLPIVVPHVVAAIFAIHILSQNGLLARIAYALGLISDQQQFPGMVCDPNGIGIITAYIWKEIPFIIYFVIALMSNINEHLGEAAVNLGAGKWTSFRKVTLPLCRSTILSGFLIVFTFTLGAYEIPLLLGATTNRTLPILAYIQYTHPDLHNRPYAMALNGIIIMISMMSAFLYFKLMQKSTKNWIHKEWG